MLLNEVEGKQKMNKGRLYILCKFAKEITSFFHVSLECAYLFLKQDVVEVLPFFVLVHNIRTQ